MRIQHWQDIASLLLGVWLVVSPFAFGFGGVDLWMTIALGLGVILFAVEGFVIPSYLGRNFPRPGSDRGALDRWLRVGIGHGK